MNLQKSELKPPQEFTFLGYRFNTVLHRVYPPQKWLDKLLSVLDSFNTTVSYTAHQWESMLGLLASTEKLVPLGTTAVPGSSVGLCHPITARNSRRESGSHQGHQMVARSRDSAGGGYLTTCRYSRTALPQGGELIAWTRQCPAYGHCQSLFYTSTT